MPKTHPKMKEGKYIYFLSWILHKIMGLTYLLGDVRQCNCKIANSVVFKKFAKAKAKQKNRCVSGYMLLKIRVGRSDYFFLFFVIILFA